MSSPKEAGFDHLRGVTYRSRMSRKKLSTTVYITPEQDERLKKLNERTKVPVAEYIRQGNDAKARILKEAEASAETLEVAELMGLDVNDPKVVERLNKRSQRSYGKYGS